MNIKKAFEIDGKLLPTATFDPFTEEDKKNYEEAMKRVEQLKAVADITHAIAETSTSLAKAENDPARIKQIISDLEMRAKAGDIAAAYQIGGYYLGGRHSLPKDEVKGLDYLLVAAHKGFADAQAKAGRHYMYVTKQRNRALPYLYAAAIQGNADANLLLGINFKEGEPNVLERDPIEALRYLKRATTDTPLNAQYAWERGVAAHVLGEIYRDGDGVSVDHSEAIKWYRMASANGIDVKMDLARLLRSQNDPAAREEAETLIADAAQKGDKSAQSVLGAEQWDRELAGLNAGDTHIGFFLVQGKVLGSETKSDKHIRSMPGAGNMAPMVYTVTDTWKVMYFENQANGEQKKINLPDDAKNIAFTAGERVAVLYGGLKDSTGDVTGYPYMIYCLDQKKIVRVEKVAKLLKECGVSNMTSKKKLWFGLAASSLFSLVSFIGIFGVAGFGYMLYRSPKSGVANPSGLVSGHFDKIESWVYANLV